jgi:hypothetical protein
VRQAASETGFVANPIEATICEDAASKSTNSTITPSRRTAKFIISVVENMLAQYKNKQHCNKQCVLKKSKQIKKLI